MRDLTLEKAVGDALHSANLKTGFFKPTDFSKEEKMTISDLMTISELLSKVSKITSAINDLYIPSLTNDQRGHLLDAKLALRSFLNDKTIDNAL
jgi:hypothetical protein